MDDDWGYPHDLETKTFYTLYSTTSGDDFYEEAERVFWKITEWHQIVQFGAHWWSHAAEAWDKSGGFTKTVPDKGMEDIRSH